MPPPSADDTDAAITALLAKLRRRAAIERSPLAALPAPGNGVVEDGVDDA